MEKASCVLDFFDCIDLGCAVLYLSVFPCTYRNVEGIILF